MNDPQTVHPLCAELQATVVSHAAQIQEAFDRYQQACFIARSAEFFCLELCGEAGELANLEKKRWKGASVADERIRDEAADVFIALMNYANARGVNLAQAVADKLQRIPPSNSQPQNQP
jgi:NTP pyrophosphatase (non-canonical NTP hydrolase)